MSTRDGKRLLVCGATGYLGRYLVKAAQEHGCWVRALVRDERRLGFARDFVDDVFVGHAARPETLDGLCDNIDVVISSLGNRTFKRKPTPWEVDYGANMNIVEQAREAGVRRLMFVSVLHGDRMRTHVPQFEARECVVDALLDGAVPWTIVRPSGFYNDMAEFVEMARKGSVWIPGSGETRFNPIHGADLAEAMVEIAEDPGSLGREFSIGGPDVVTMRDVAELAFEALEQPPKIRRVPSWLLTAAGKTLRPFNTNVASLLLMFSALTQADAVAERYGARHLADFFRELTARDDALGARHAS